MARRYENGVIVGEPDPPKTLPQIAKWCHDEWALARERRERESTDGAHVLATRACLSGREAVLGELLTMFGRL